MAVNWLSLVYYNEAESILLTTAPVDPHFIRGTVPWKVHWTDPSVVHRLFYVSSLAEDPKIGCEMLQALSQGQPVRWAVIEPGELFPVFPGANPVSPPRLCA